MTPKGYWAFVAACFALLGITVWGTHVEFKDRAATHQAQSGLISALQDQVKALGQRLDEQAEWSRTTDREVGIQRDRLERVRIDLNAVMARKPPTEETHWIVNRFDRDEQSSNRHEQRIGQLEFTLHGAKK